MSYALLWIELLAISLLWTATTAALAAHVKWKGDRILALAGLVALPLALIWKWVAIIQWLPYWARPSYLLSDHWYGWLLTTWTGFRILALIYCVVAAFLLLRVMRRPQRGMARVVAIVLLALVPMTGLSTLVVEMGWVKYQAEVPTPWFVYFLSLLLAAIVGAVLIVFFAVRRSQPGLGWSALVWPRGKLAVGTITAAAVGLMTVWNMELEMRSRAAMLRLEAGNLSLSAMPLEGGGQNAGPLYMVAFARLNRDHSEVLEAIRDTRTRSEVNAGVPPTDPRPQRGVGLYSFLRVEPTDPRVIALLKRHEQTVRLLRQAAQRPSCRFEEGPPARYIMDRRVVGLLYLHARSEVLQGRIESALDDVNTLFRFRDHLAQAHSRWTHLCFLDELATTDVLQEVLPYVTRTEQLDALEIGDAPSIRRIMRRGFEAEEAWGLGRLSDIAAGQARHDPNGDSYEIYHALSGEPSTTLARLFILPGDIEVYRQFMARCQQDATKPYFQVRGHIVEIHHWSQSDPHLTLIASPLAPHVTYTFEMAARAEAAHATAVVAIAAMRYKLAHGHLPEKLADLLSDELDEIPKDPFDGQPLRMTVVDGKWTVYSVGPDGIDDGGKLRAGWQTYEHRDGDKGDILFTLDSSKAPA